MRIKLQLSGVKDADLIALYLHPDFDLARNLERVLRSYVRNGVQEDRISLPASDISISSLDSQIINIYLNEKKDNDVIEFIKQIRMGFRTSVIKTIFRNSLIQPYIPGFIFNNEPIAIPKKTPFAPTVFHEPDTPKIQSIKNTSEPNENLSQTKNTVLPNTENETDLEWDLFSEDGFVENY